MRFCLNYLKVQAISSLVMANVSKFKNECDQKEVNYSFLLKNFRVNTF